METDTRKNYGKDVESRAVKYAEEEEEEREREREREEKERNKKEREMKKFQRN